MSGAAFLEMLISLAVQAGIVVVVTDQLVRRLKPGRTGDRLWSTCHVVLLLMTVYAVSCPHLRLLPHSLIARNVNITRVVNPEMAIGLGLAIVWSIGVVFSLSLLVTGTYHSVRLLRTSKPIPAERLRKRWLQAAPLGSESDRPIAQKQSIRFLTNPVLRSPFCWQIHRPAVVLPEFALDFSDEELTAIVVHETAHLRSGHPLQLFLQRLVEALYWFHPLIWWASRQATQQREFACDGVAVTSRAEISTYLRSLLKLAERGVVPAGSLPAGLPFGGSGSLVQQRANRILERDWEQVPPTSSVRALPVVLFAVGLFATTIWFPIDVTASERSLWSPWPPWSAYVLDAVGLPVRDYERDGHRLRPPWHHHRTPESMSDPSTDQNRRPSRVLSNSE